VKDPLALSPVRTPPWCGPGPPARGHAPGPASPWILLGPKRNPQARGARLAGFSARRVSSNDAVRAAVPPRPRLRRSNNRRALARLVNLGTQAARGSSTASCRCSAAAQELSSRPRTLPSSKCCRLAGPRQPQARGDPCGGDPRREIERRRRPRLYETRRARAKYAADVTQGDLARASSHRQLPIHRGRETSASPARATSPSRPPKREDHRPVSGVRRCRLRQNRRQARSSPPRDPWRANQVLAASTSRCANVPARNVLSAS